MPKPRYNLPAGCTWASVDPGSEGTGIAIWKDDKLLDVRTFTASGDTWLLRAVKIALDAWVFFYRYLPDTFFFEDSFVRTDTPRFLVAAKTGVVKLAMLTGMLIMQGIDVPTGETKADKLITLIPPRKWKGDLPDKVLKKRVNEWAVRTGRILSAPLTIHGYCAVGIGLHVLGEL